MGKLDTAMVNGPEGDVLDWDAVDWRRVEDDVRRLRQRIFTATQAGDLKKVRNLQKLMLRSRANALLSVRRVTERNAGCKTAGVDGRAVLGAGEKAELADWLQHDATGRRQWALDADLAAAFDQIDHTHLLDQLGSFPARGRIAAWLKAGVIDQGRFAPTERGSPQGGVVSPVLLNVALHGMEQAAGVRYIPSGSNAGTARPDSPVLVRYADDLLALCLSREQAQQVKARLAAWLAPRGLVFNEDKTRIVHLDEGCDFLGFNIRRYHGKLLITPSKTAVKRLRERLATEMRAVRGHNAQMVLVRLNPIIRGWSAYYRHCVSARVFNELDNHVWKLTYKWAKWTHPHKSKHWIIARYFGAFNSSRRDRWVFGDRASGAYLVKFAWMKITRHTLVKGWASPDDPALAGYWAARRHRGRPPLDRARLRLLQQQRGRCPLCGELLLHADQEPQHPDEWERWITATRQATRHQAIALDTGPKASDQPIAVRLIHTHCRRRLPDGTGSRPAALLHP